MHLFYNKNGSVMKRRGCSESVDDKGISWLVTPVNSATQSSVELRADQAKNLKAKQ